MHKRRRLMDAIADLSATRGYQATSIAALVRHAEVARKTLYDNFESKEEVFLAALDSGISEGLRRTEAACEAAGGDWRQRIGAGLDALLQYLAENPAEAHIFMIEALSATPASSARYDAAIERFIELLRQNVPAGNGLPGTIEETLVGGVAWILHREIRRGKAGSVTALCPELRAFLFAPYESSTKRGP